MEQTCYTQRLSARVIDLMLVGLVMLVLEKVMDDFGGGSLVPAYLLYEVTVAALNGRSLGKYLLSLTVKTSRRGFGGCLARIIREPLLLILSPLVFLNLIVMSPLPLHDRIAGTRVVCDEI